MPPKRSDLLIRWERYHCISYLFYIVCLSIWKFLTCVHLPDVDGAVRTSHNQVVVCRTPLDDLNGEEVSGRQHDALSLPETQQTDRVITGHRADAVLHTSLRRRNQTSVLTQNFFATRKKNLKFK